MGVVPPLVTPLGDFSKTVVMPPALLPGAGLLSMASMPRQYHRKSSTTSRFQLRFRVQRSNRPSPAWIVPVVLVKSEPLRPASRAVQASRECRSHTRPLDPQGHGRILLQLDGGVVDAEASVQHGVQRLQQAVALARIL